MTRRGAFTICPARFTGLRQDPSPALPGRGGTPPPLTSSQKICQPLPRTDGTRRRSLTVAHPQILPLVVVLLLLAAPFPLFFRLELGDAEGLQRRDARPGEAVAGEDEFAEGLRVGAGGQRPRPLVGDAAILQVEDREPLQDARGD